MQLHVLLLLKLGHGDFEYTHLLFDLEQQLSRDEYNYPLHQLQYKKYYISTGSILCNKAP